MVVGFLPSPIMEHEGSVSVHVSQEYYIHWKLSHKSFHSIEHLPY